MSLKNLMLRSAFKRFHAMNPRALPPEWRDLELPPAFGADELGTLKGAGLVPFIYHALAALSKQLPDADDPVDAAMTGLEMLSAGELSREAVLAKIGRLLASERKQRNKMVDSVGKSIARRVCREAQN